MPIYIYGNLSNAFYSKLTFLNWIQSIHGIIWIAVAWKQTELLERHVTHQTDVLFVSQLRMSAHTSLFHTWSWNEHMDSYPNLPSDSKRGFSVHSKITNNYSTIQILFHFQSSYIHRPKLSNFQAKVVNFSSKQEKIQLSHCDISGV